MKYILLLVTSMMILGCTYEVIEIPEECTEELVATIQEQSNSACGSANGSFSVLVQNGGYGSNPFTFQINNNAAQSLSSFDGLSAGSYSVLVSDGVCETTLNVDISNEDGLSAVAVTEESSCGESTGSISVSFADASGNVEFSIDGGAAQSGSDFNDLPAGEYIINVSDEAGCSVEIPAVVENESNYTRIETIVNASCAVSGCHAGNVSPDLRVKANVLSSATRIMARTSAMTMPPSSSGTSLNTAEIEDIACWAESGGKG